MKIVLREVQPPPYRFAEEMVPPIPVKEYERRLACLYEIAHSDWVVVYGDREHYANLTYLVNFDPRFEEALLLLGPGGVKTLVVGNEDMGYGAVLPFPINMVLAQSFSLCGQQRDTAPRLLDVLKTAGIQSGQSISLIGWKYLEPFETDSPSTPAFVPALIVDHLRMLVGQDGKVEDGTVLMMHPEHGLRAVNTCAQIAVFEWAARNCSAGVFGVIRGARPGMSEWEAMHFMRYSGFPQSMHPIFASGNNEINGLRSANGRTLKYGDAVSTALGYWGSLVCRAGMMLGEVDNSFVDRVAGPYFQVLASWYQLMQNGISGGEIYDNIGQAFNGTGMRSSLNPGHLISYEEWLHTPIRRDSNEKVKSGMVFQADIIPTPLRPGELINCEDTIAIADEALRSEIRFSYPEMWARIQARRDYMRSTLGISLHDEVLPLTDGTAYLPPFWLLPDLVCTVVQ